MTIKDTLVLVHDRPATRKRFDIALGLAVPFGRYGPSRLREAWLGGATRTLLGRAPLPVLLSH